MDKQSTVSSSKSIGPPSYNMVPNPNLSLTKMKEILTSLDKAAKAVIIPILKIKRKISMKFDVFVKDYKEIKEKAELANKEIIKHQEESKSDTMNITDIQLNQKYAINHENMIVFYESISNNIDLFTKLFNSDEYDNLIKGFDELIPDSEMCIEEDIKNEKQEIIQIARDNIKLKKPKRPPPRRKGARKPLKRLGGTTTSSSNKKKIQKVVKRKLRDVDLLQMLHKDFPTNSYVNKISKTFINRRLYKKVIYRHIFDYKENGQIEENKLRSVGESFVYKYSKATFKFLDDEIKNTEKIDEILGKELRQQFARLDEENKEYIIGGNIGCSASELVGKIFRRNLFSEFSVVRATLEFYEFYEELVSEFNEKEENVRVIFCDEKVLNRLREDWKNLQMVRNYVKEIKDKEGTI